MKNTEILLEDTYKNIMRIHDSLEKANSELEECRANLSCCLQILEMLIGLMDIDEILKQQLIFLFCKCHYYMESQVSFR